MLELFFKVLQAYLNEKYPAKAPAVLTVVPVSSVVPEATLLVPTKTPAYPKVLVPKTPIDYKAPKALSLLSLMTANVNIGTKIQENGYIKLTVNKGKEVLIDNADVHILDRGASWYLSSGGYLLSLDPYIIFHREVMNAKKGEYIRFKSGNKLDCRRANLVMTGTPAEKLRENVSSDRENVSSSAKITPVVHVEMKPLASRPTSKHVVRVVYNNVPYYGGVEDTLKKAQLAKIELRKSLGIPPLKVSRANMKKTNSAAKK